MRSHIQVSIMLLLMALSVCSGQSVEPRTFTTITTDSVTIFGEVYESSSDRTKPVILLFHQGGGDTRGEYGPLVGRLTAEGYHAIAIDQRRGGDRFGGENRTLRGLTQDRQYAYCDVYPDLVAALIYAREQGFSGKMLAWGSSYSAALVFRLAMEYPTEISAVLAFSPAAGEPMAGCEPLPWAKRILTPGLIIRPLREVEHSWIEEQLNDFRGLGYQTYVADPGVHGSSVLNEERVGGNVEPAWQTVLGFLHRVTSLSSRERADTMRSHAETLSWTLGSWEGYREDGSDGSRARMRMTVSAILADGGYRQDLEVVHDGGTYRGAAMDVYDPVAGRWVRQYVNGTNGRFVRVHGVVEKTKSTWRSADPERSRDSFLHSEISEEGVWTRTMNVHDEGEGEWRVLWQDVLRKK